jgi:two-component system phosphate regulon sensor histidine kinase PhoR
MSSTRSTRRFLRWFSITALLAVLVVGLGGLTALWLSTSRTQAITNTLDPAIAANSSVLQVLTRAQADAGVLLAGSSTGTAAPVGPDQLSRLDDLARAASAQLDPALGAVAQAGSVDHHVRGRITAQRSAAEVWLRATRSVASSLADRQPARAQSLQAIADADFAQFETANDATARTLGDARLGLQTDATRLRNLAEGSLGGLVLFVLVALAGMGAVATRLLVAPMVELTGVVERLRRGDETARAPTDHGSQEVRSVALQVNALADEVQEWRWAQAETDRLRRTFSEISRTVREELDMDSVFDVPAMIGPALGADRCWLRLTRDGRIEDVVRQWAREGLAPLERIPLAVDDPYEAALGLWRREEAMSRPDLTARLELEPLAVQLFVAETGVRSFLVVPIGAGESVLGLLTWAMTDRPRVWTAAEVVAAQRVAADLGRAIVHASLYERQVELVARLRDLDRRKDDFLATISHELRTPLTSIIGYLDLVRDGAVGEVPVAMRPLLDVVDENADRLRALIEDLLLLARIEDRSLRPTQDRVVVADLVHQAVDAIRVQAESGGVRLSVDPGPASLAVVGDARHLALAMRNILGNAVKFTPSRGLVSVTVRHDPERGDVVLTCSDSGIGVPESEQADLFQRFFRASNAARHAVPGTGLGMSVVKGIVDAHGGAVALTSHEGMGTIVTVRLPAGPLAAETAAETATEGNAHPLAAVPPAVR